MWRLTRGGGALCHPLRHHWRAANAPNPSPRALHYGASDVVRCLRALPRPVDGHAKWRVCKPKCRHVFGRRWQAQQIETEPAQQRGPISLGCGRYLITHNHYPVTAAALNNGGEGVVTAVSILKASGGIILLKAPLSYFKVVREEPGGDASNVSLPRRSPRPRRCGCCWAAGES